jgi:hypothetical protein
MSHTTTGEWKSFEVRMRRRRAERLVVRAEAAADAGYVEDAREYLAEARRLAPGVAGIADVERKLTVPAAPSAAATSARVWPSAAAMLVVLTLGGWLLRPGPVAPTRKMPSLELAAPAPSAGAATSSPPSGGVAQPDAVVESTAGRTETAVPAPAAAARTERDRHSIIELENRHADPGLAAVAPGVPVLIGPIPLRAPDAVPPDTVTPIPVDGEVAAVAAAVDALPLPAPPPALPSPRADAGVRAVLDRYAAAYSALDADAAERAWPGVNRVALTRAFDSLASQRISLGECRIDITGAAARASCAGTATWAPKIGGGGARTEARRWTFELARAATAWQIVSARVQNR